MNITPSTTVDVVRTAVSITLDKVRADWVNAMIDDIAKAYKDEHDQAYTSLIEKIKKMKINQDFVSIGNMDFTVSSLYADGHDNALLEIIEKVVKPLYNKE